MASQMSDASRHPPVRHLVAAVNDLLLKAHEPEFWLHIGSSLNKVWSLVAECATEFQLQLKFPEEVHDGKPQRSISMYEYIVRKMDILMSMCPNEYYKHLEVSVLNEALRGCCGISRQMAADVFCHMVRSGPASLCDHYCHLLAQLLCSFQQPLDGFNHTTNAVRMLRRLISFTSESSKVRFIGKFPPEQNLKLWAVLPLGMFSTLGSSGATFIHELMVMSIGRLQNIGSSEKVAGHITDKATDLHNVGRFLEDEDVRIQLSEDTMRTIIVFVTSLWSSLPHTSREVTSLNVALLNVTSQLVDRLKDCQVEEIMPKIISLAGLEDVSFAMATCQFLRECRKISVGSASNYLPTLFGRVLCHPNILVHQMALVAFTDFAKETVQENLVRETVERNPAIQEDAINFVNKRPKTVLGFDIAEILDSEKQCISACVSIKFDNQRGKIDDQVALLNDATEQEDYVIPNRSADSDSLEEISKTLSSTVHTITRLETPLPIWFRSEIRNCVTNLNKLLSPRGPQS